MDIKREKGEVLVQGEAFESRGTNMLHASLGLGGGRIVS